MILAAKIRNLTQSAKSLGKDLADCFMVYSWEFIDSSLSDLLQSLTQVINDVINVLCTDAQTYGAGSNVLLSQFLG